MKGRAALSRLTFFYLVRRGVSYYHNECKLSHYADDTTFGCLFDILEKFGKVSGLPVNCEKLELAGLTPRKDQPKFLCCDKNLKWADGKVRIK